MSTILPTKRTLRAAVVALCLIGLAVANAPAMAAGETAEQKASTASYNLTLDIGPAEMMLTSDQAKAQKATSGEVMAAMPGMGAGTAMAMAPGNRHIVLHVYQKVGGAPVKNAMVAITLTNTTTRASMPVRPIAAMYGAAQGEGDWHYGNNAQVTDGSYRATVNVDGQAATFAPATIGAVPAASGSVKARPTIMPSLAPLTGGGASFSDLPQPVGVVVVVSLSVVAGVMLQRIKRAALESTRGAGTGR